MPTIASPLSSRRVMRRPASRRSIASGLIRISVRSLGIVSLAGQKGFCELATGQRGFCAAHQGSEFLEEIVAVVRTRGGFGVVLHAERWKISVPQSLDRL